MRKIELSSMKKILSRSTYPFKQQLCEADCLKGFLFAQKVFLSPLLTSCIPNGIMGVYL